MDQKMAINFLKDRIEHYQKRFNLASMNTDEHFRVHVNQMCELTGNDVSIYLARNEQIKIESAQIIEDLNALIEMIKE